ncbi:MAG: PHP domain-containing protein [Eubacteriales bacterium]|nr:PHP domain-containing protein [Eubacteriales bacterium]
MSIGFDLHTHTNKSDGTATPSELVKKAARRHILMLAISDHDTVAGVSEAQEEAKQCGVILLPSVEMDAEWPTELHILGIDIDANDQGLLAALQKLQEARSRRNERILQKLADIGCDVRGHMPKSEGLTSRLHIAMALCSAGYAAGKADAFDRYLKKGCPAYCTEQRLSPEEIIRVITKAGGIPVLAHPCKLSGNVHETVRQLAGWGIMGLEAYYPASSKGTTALFESLAAQYNLLVTAGSDYHGNNRKDVRLGCAWQDVPSLINTEEFLQNRLQMKETMQ